MKKMLFVFLSLFWLTLLVSTGHSQSKHRSAHQGKQTFVYDIDQTDVQLFQVQRNGTLKGVNFNYYYDDVDVGRLPRCIIATPNGRTLYVSSDVNTFDAHSGQIIQFAIGRNGRLTRLGSVDAGTLPLRLAMDKSGSFLYCAAEDGANQQGVIYQYRIEHNGTLSTSSPPLVNLGKSFAQDLAVHPWGKYLYATTANKPICFRISRNGTISRLPMPPISIDVKELALGPSGRVVYLLQSGGIVSAATIDQHTGLFSHLRSVAHVPPFAFGMAISSQQKVLQITDEHTTGHNNWIAGPVFEFRLMPNGGLTPATPPTFPATYPFVQSYRRLAPDPSNGFVVVTR